MPLRDDLLNPVPGENPCGENLRYAAVYDKIKEARREDDDAPQGEWQRERKTADYPLVLKLAGEALATKSKDLQLAVWITEALIKTESFSGLKAGLDLIKGLIEKYWDGLYPEIEDGDLELRAAPLDWLGSRMDATLRMLPLTKSGINWYQFKEARAIGYEADAADDSAKLEAREAAIAEGKKTMEDWDAAFNSSPKSFYAGLEETLDGILETLGSLSELCGTKFGDDAPSFGPMQTTIEEIRHTVHGLLQKKRETEPDEAPEPIEEPAGEAESLESKPSGEAGYSEETGPMPVVRKKTRPAGAPPAPEPVDKEDAFRRVVAIAAYLRKEDPYSAAPYLLLRGLRFGELRSAGSELDPNLLEAPATEIRQSLKKAANEGDWAQVIEIAETAMGLPCGRGWLDLQRYVYRAAYELGYYQVQAAVRSEVNALLADYPALRQASLLDDTPAANTETQSWLDEIAPASPASAAPVPAVSSPDQESAPPQEDGAQRPDAYALAQQAAGAGRQQEAIEILMREAAAEKSGRGRFQRRLQLAHLCISMGYAHIALPILEQITAEIDARNLEGWESPAFVAQPFSLLYQCLANTDAPPELKQKIYDRICRLDPLQALACRR